MPKRFFDGPNTQRTSPRSVNPFDFLPNEIILYILSFIPRWQRRFDGTELRAVCRTFRDILDSCVRHLSIRNTWPALTVDIVCQKIMRCSNLVSLHLDDIYPCTIVAEQALFAAISSCTRLKQLYMIPATFSRTTRITLDHDWQLIVSANNDNQMPNAFPWLVSFDRRPFSMPDKQAVLRSRDPAIRPRPTQSNNMVTLRPVGNYQKCKIITGEYVGKISTDTADFVEYSEICGKSDCTTLATHCVVSYANVYGTGVRTMKSINDSTHPHLVTNITASVQFTKFLCYEPIRISLPPKPLHLTFPAEFSFQSLFSWMRHAEFFDVPTITVFIHHCPRDLNDAGESLELRKIRHIVLRKGAKRFRRLLDCIVVPEGRVLTFWVPPKRASLLRPLLRPRTELCCHVN